MSRLIFQAFILEVQHAILHSGEMCMSPFELNLELPCSEEAWIAEDVDTWLHALSENERHGQASGQQRFLSVLKQFWNQAAASSLAADNRADSKSGNSHRTNSASHRNSRQQQQQSQQQLLSFSYLRDSRIVMYGVMSIAWEMRRRYDNNSSAASTLGTSGGPRMSTPATTTTLSSRVQNSFEGWVAWWGSHVISISLEKARCNWRSCSCMFQMAHNLYEVGPRDLQMLAGKEISDGKRSRSSDYLRSNRKIRKWVKQEYSLVGVSCTASLFMVMCFHLHYHLPSSIQLSYITYYGFIG
jgi:hypothetical protein